MGTTIAPWAGMVPLGPMSSPQKQQILVTVTGPDHPGITAELCRTVAANHANLIDIEQVVVKDQLTLCLLVDDGGCAKGEPLLKDLLFAAKRMGLEMQFDVIGSNGRPADHDVDAETSEGRRYAITAIGEGLTADGVGRIAKVLEQHKANIENIRRLSNAQLLSLEIVCSLPQAADKAASLRGYLLTAVEGLDIDIAVQRERLTRRSKRLVVMDMDSTLIQIEVIDEMARLHGVVDKVSAITKRAMAGELDFEESLRERVKLLEGLALSEVERLSSDLPITDGVRQLLAVLHRLGYKTAVISGGFTIATNALRKELGFDYAYANVLEIANGKLTGKVIDPIVTPQRKADLLETIAQQEGIALEQTIAIGDGANDLGMLDRAGLGIAFHAKAKLRKAADTSVSAGGLDRVLYLLGLHERDIDELLASETPSR